MDRKQLTRKSLADLKELIKELKIELTHSDDINSLKKKDIVELILSSNKINKSNGKSRRPRTSTNKNKTEELSTGNNEHQSLDEAITQQKQQSDASIDAESLDNSSNVREEITKESTGQQSKLVSNGNENGDSRTSFENTIEVSGVLEINPENSHGILRSSSLKPSSKDTYISISQVKKLKLRRGDFIEGYARYPRENERYHSLIWVNSVNGSPLEEFKGRPQFEELKPIYPNKQIKLECGQYPIANRIIDILCPIGFGQRAMIVAPPKAGKTTLLKDIAKGINTNHPDIQLIVVLIGERPEEVTDIERSVNGIVYASNFDESPQDQVTVAELSLERAKRLVELGKDVVILMDSLTRLARAYNVALPASGRTLSGGLDPVSLYPSKKFFGAARNFENGASLTIVATALVETGSKMDDVIFEEFKGTGNMELKLDRKLSNKRVFPAIDLKNSGTRNEELLLSHDLLQISWRIRKMLDSIDDGTEALIERMKSTKSNEEFLNTLHQY